MPKGYAIVVRNYIAEIVEFRTIEIFNAPDGIKIYHVETKYGDDYFYESAVRAVRKELEKECEDINRALGKKNARS